MIKLPSMQPDLVAKEIQKFILNTINQHKKSGVILGLSGGIDSSVVAVLCKRAIEGTSHGMVGYFIPHKVADESRTYIGQLVDAFELPMQIIPIEFICDGHISLLEQHCGTLNNYQKGNLFSRVRANVLSTLAEKENKTLSGTGNKDEDYGVGYYTLFGDGAVHMNPIGCLSKRLVYQMATYLEIPEAIRTRPPTAGLEENQTDSDDLGYFYSTVEIITEAMTQGVNIVALIKKLEERQIIFDSKRFQNVGDVIGDVISRNLVAKSKAQIIHPPVPTVTLNYIDMDTF